jgi:SAM-dependent methyltransferase
MDGSYLDRLYVDPREWRKGWGTRLIQLAKELSPGGLELHTHQANRAARALYERHGSVAVKYGLSPPAEHYDLVHCRALLMHLPQPVVALERMAAAVRPGGWLCLEEYDFSTFGGVDPQYPGAAAFHLTFHALLDALRTAGGGDGALGRRLLVLIERLGCANVGPAGEVGLGRGGSPLWENAGA